MVASPQRADLTATLSPLRHMWSLAVEEQFYLLWPLILLPLLRWRRLLAIVVGVLAAGSAIVMVVTYNPANSTRAYVGTDVPRLPS